MEIISFTVVLISVSTGLIGGVLICQWMNKERDKQNFIKGYSEATDKALDNLKPLLVIMKELHKILFKKDE